MVRKIITFLTVACLSICAFGLIACSDRTPTGQDGDKACVHEYAEYVYNNDATCVSDGTETAKCGKCGEVDTRTKPNTATGVHTYKTYKSNNDAACGVNGTETAKCEHCDATDTRTADDSALGHDWVETVIKNATCTEDGEIEKACKLCNATELKTIDALGHDFEWKTDMSTHESVCRHAGCGETIAPEKHDWASDNVCKECSYELPYTRGLSYGPNDTGDGCVVKIPEKITSELLVIPAYHDGLPVTSVQPVSKSLSRLFPKTIVEVYLPYTVTEIGSGVFYYGSGLKSVDIQGEITKLGAFAFSGTALFSDEENWDENGMLYISDILVSAAKATGVVSVKDGTALIANSAFYNNSGVTEITLPDSVKYIGQLAFGSCGKLEKVVIPAEIEFIDSYAFDRCSKLASVYYKGSVEQWCTMNTLSNPLENNSALYIKDAQVTELVVPDTVDKIRDKAFACCTSITSAVIRDGVKEIGEGAFQSCVAMTSVSVPNSVEVFGDSVFTHCDKLAKTTTSDAFYIGNSSNRYLILYAINTRVTSCNINSGTKFIHSSAGSIHDNLTSVSMPSSVKSIGSGAFYMCTGIGSMTIGSGVVTIGDVAFEGCKFDYLNIPDSVKSIGEESFDSCWMSSMHIGAGLENIGKFAFDDCSKLSYITVSADNAKYHSAGNCLIETATKTLIRGCKNSVIPDDGSVVEIAVDAFQNCVNMTQLKIPNSVTKIGTISVCRELRTVTVGNNVTSMNGIGAFCGSIQYNTYDNGCYFGTADNPYAVFIKAKNTDVTSCIIHRDTTLIASNAFYNCKSMDSVTIPKGVKNMSTNAFSNSNIKSVYYEGTLTDWCNIDFANKEANPLGSNIGYPMLYVDNIAVEDAVVLPDGITEIKDFAFAEYRKIKSLTVPASVKRIGKQAFYNAKSLKTVQLGASVESIAEEAFSECVTLSSFEFNGTVEAWKNILRGPYWDMNTASFTVTCTDGNVVDE